MDYTLQSDVSTLIKKLNSLYAQSGNKPLTNYKSKMKEILS